MKLTKKQIKELIKVDIKNYQELEIYYHNEKNFETSKTFRIKRRALESLLKYINYLESI